MILMDSSPSSLIKSVCVENALISSSSQPDDFLGHKWWISSEANARGEIQKRNKRLIVPRRDVLPAPEVTKAFEVPSPAPQAAQKSRRKGNRNSKKKGNGNGKDDMAKTHKSFSETDKTLKKQNKIKKTHTAEFFRQGQSPRRLQQHMQHKKKVKQFLQKRIQEQIEQRNQNPPFVN